MGTWGCRVRPLPGSSQMSITDGWLERFPGDAQGYWQAVTLYLYRWTEGIPSLQHRCRQADRLGSIPDRHLQLAGGGQLMPRTPSTKPSPAIARWVAVPLLITYLVLVVSNAMALRRYTTRFGPWITSSTVMA